jgi:hypothetical protein
MGLCDEVRRPCATVAASARWVEIEPDAMGRIEPGPQPELDRERHYLEGSREDVAAYILTLDSINFGSGWFPTLRKRPGCSGYFTVAWALADRFRGSAPWSNAELRGLTACEVADTLGQEPEHELMALYARALNDLGAWLAERTALEVVAEAGGSAERLAEQLAAGMPFFDDRGFYKRAQIVPNDLALAGVASFDDLDRLTIFADNLVPHVLRLDGVLAFDDDLVARIDAEQLIEHDSPEEVEIRACALHAVELLVAAHPEPTDATAADNTLWHRGGEPRYKAHPRHRARTTAY